MQITININIDDRAVNFIKSLFTRKKAITILTVLGLALTILLPGAQITNLNTFTTGQVASASAVNANFETLRTTVNALDNSVTDLSSNYWLKNGTGDLYFMGGNVAIGTSDTTYALEVVKDGNSATITGTTYREPSAFGTSFFGRRARGNISALSPVLLDDYLANFGGGGYDGSKFTSSRGSMSVHAAENWSGTANGTYLAFQTTPIGTTDRSEVMRIDSKGNVGIGTTTPYANLDIMTDSSITGNPSLVYLRDKRTDAALVNMITFVRDFPGSSDWIMGSITTNSSGTNYNTTSDYRLKENLKAIKGATERIMELPVWKFNFKRDPGVSIDGFMAHEVQKIIPYAVTGKKDAVDKNNNPVYQMLDYSKLVSLLTAAIQESIKRIQKLESMHKKEMAYSAQKDKDISQLKAENEILKKHYSSLDARLIALEKGTSMNLGARPIKENKEISIFEKIQFRVKKIFQ